MKKIFTLSFLLVAMLAFSARAELYIIGQVDGTSWNYAGVGLPLTQSVAAASVYTGDFHITGYFGIINNNEATSWDDLNNNYRYGPTTGDGTVPTSEPSAIKLGTGDAWNIGTAGEYTVTVDIEALTIKVEAKSTDPEPEPVEGDCFLIGEVNGKSWAYNDGVALEVGPVEGVYIGDVTFNDNAYFSVATSLSATGWTDLNENYRFGPETNGDAVTPGTAMTMYKGDAAWRVATAGTYSVTVNLNDNTILLVQGGDTPEPEPELGLFILGEVEGSEWNPGNGLSFVEQKENVYEGTFTINGAFGLITNNDSSLSWDALNADYRLYPAESDGDYLIHDGNMTLATAKNGGEAWTVGEAAGLYKVTVDLNKMVMTATLVDTPTPELPDNLYVLGEVEGSEWALPGKGLALTKTAEGVFEGTFTFNGTFAFITDNEESNWDVLNAEKRYGCPSGDNVPISFDEPEDMILSSNAWNIGTAGRYKVTVDLNELTFIVTEPTTKGDLNGDGSVDGSDVSILLEMVLAGGLTDAQVGVADLNDDGSVDGSDVSILLEMVLAGE